MDLTAVELAARLRYSKGRISQLVSAGRLDGCFRGEGRARRFDLAKVAERLAIALDPGQQTGNGLRQLAARADLLAPAPAPAAPAPDRPRAEDDAARLARARADEAEVKAQQARRQLALDEGRYVLAAEVARAQASAVQRLLAEAERHLLAEVRRLAAEAGADPKAAAAEARRRWRAWRADQARVFGAAADAAAPTDAEADELAPA
jgi:hypothetical protein